MPPIHRLISTALISLGLALPSTAALATPAIAVTAHAGTLGFGGDVYMALPHSTDLRVGGSYFSISHAINSGSIHYDGTARLESVAFLADWHPFSGIFRLTGGVVYNQNRFSLTATPASGGNYTINGRTY